MINDTCTSAGYPVTCAKPVEVDNEVRHQFLS